MTSTITQTKIPVDNESTDTEKKTKKSPSTNGAQPHEATPVEAWEAPEEASASELKNDPRPPHQTQPPTKDQY